MTYSPPVSSRTRQDESMSALLSDVTSDVQLLFRQEAELAKAEVRQEATKAGKAAGMFGGAGLAAHLVLVFLSLTVVFALGNPLGLAWAALIVTAAWSIVAATLYLRGRSQLRTVSAKPEQTIESMKEDAQWARHPTK